MLRYPLIIFVGFEECLSFSSHIMGTGEKRHLQKHKQIVMC